MKGHQELPLCHEQSVPAGSKLVLLVAKSQPIGSAGGTTSVITWFLKGENHCATAPKEE